MHERHATDRRQLESGERCVKFLEGARNRLAIGCWPIDYLGGREAKERIVSGVAIAAHPRLAVKRAQLVDKAIALADKLLPLLGRGKREFDSARTNDVVRESTMMCGHDQAVESDEPKCRSTGERFSHHGSFCADAECIYRRASNCRAIDPPAGPGVSDGAADRKELDDSRWPASRRRLSSKQHLAPRTDSFTKTFRGSAIYWSSIDTWITITATLAAAACAIPGCFLFLRKQSMIADALTHAALPGVVAAFVLAGYFEAWGWIEHDGSWTVRQTLMFGGAMIAGLLTAYLTEWVTRSGWIRHDASLGVVFTTLFAIGLIMLRQFADKSDVDLDCVLYGQLETVGLADGIPGEALACGVMLLVNLLLVLVLFKELMITTFDPLLATALGFRPRLIHYGLMTVTTASVVTAFEVVGSILVIGMLVIPPSTAFFITRRLRPMIIVSVIVAVTASALGHIAAITLAGPLTSLLGLPYVDSVKTSVRSWWSRSCR